MREYTPRFMRYKRSLYSTRMPRMSQERLVALLEAEPKKRPAAAASPVKKKAKTATAVPACPPLKGKTPTVQYNGGKIHTNNEKEFFRVFPISSDVYLDRRIAFGGDREAAWQRCIDLIDEYN